MPSPGPRVRQLPGENLPSEQGLKHVEHSVGLRPRHPVRIFHQNKD